MDNSLHHLVVSSHRESHTLRTHEAPAYCHSGVAEMLTRAWHSVFSTPPFHPSVSALVTLLFVVWRCSEEHAGRGALAHESSESVPILNVEVEGGHVEVIHALHRLACTLLGGADYCPSTVAFKLFFVVVASTLHALFVVPKLLLAHISSRLTLFVVCFVRSLRMSKIPASHAHHASITRASRKHHASITRASREHHYKS